MAYNKGQIDYPIITFFVIVVGLLLLAPIMLKVFNSIQAPVSAQLGNLTGQQGVIAQQNFNAVMTPTINFWDKVIIFALILSVILLIVSSIFIDSSPFFVIIYIFIAFMLVLFAPNIVDSLDTLYNSPSFATENSQLSFIITLKDNFGIFLVGLIVLTGIIIYGKVALSRSGGRRQ